MRISEAGCDSWQALAMCLNVEQRAHWLLNRKNQSAASCDNDVIVPD